MKTRRKESALITCNSHISNTGEIGGLFIQWWLEQVTSQHLMETHTINWILGIREFPCHKTKSSFNTELKICRPPWHLISGICQEVTLEGLRILSGSRLYYTDQELKFTTTERLTKQSAFCNWFSFWQHHEDFSACQNFSQRKWVVHCGLLK